MIASVRRTLFGQTTVWALGDADDPRIGFGEPLYRALAVRLGGEMSGDVHAGGLSQTPLDDKERITRGEAAALHPALVRRAEAAFGAAPDARPPVTHEPEGYWDG